MNNKPKRLTEKDLREKIYDTVYDAICDEAYDFNCFHINLYSEVGTDEFYEIVEEETKKWLDKLLK